MYQGVDEVVKLDNKLSKFIDFQTNYNKKLEMELDQIINEGIHN